MPYKVVDVYKDLPRRAGCSECGKPGCFAFATAVYLEGAPVELCSYLEPEARRRMEERLAAGRDAGDGVRPEVAEQAAAHLLGKLREAPDLGLLTDRAEAEHREAEEALRLSLLGRAYVVRRDGVDAEGAGEPPNVWVKVLLLLYVTRATGEPLHDEWVAFRELPSTVAKHKTYDKWVDRIAERFAGRPAELAEAAARCGGEPVGHESADRAFLFRALPRVPLLLLFWEGDEDFDGRATLLLDRGVLDYLDQESLVFLAETLMSRMLGEADPTG